jgi:hypothetical protein
MRLTALLESLAGFCGYRHRYRNDLDVYDLEGLMPDTPMAGRTTPL